MKFTDLTIDQFQRIAAIEANGDPALKKVATIAVIRNISLDESKKMPLTEVNEAYKSFEESVKQLPTLKYQEYVKCNGKKYKLVLFTDELTGGQLIEMLSYDLRDEYQVVQNLHKIMATLACERTWWRTKPYDGATHGKRAEEFKQLSMKDVWGAVSFFLLASESYSKIMLRYSEALMKTMAKG